MIKRAVDLLKEDGTIIASIPDTAREKRIRIREAHTGEIEAQNRKLIMRLEQQQAYIEQLREQNIYYKESFDIISNAFFWKITKPFRAALDTLKSIFPSRDHMQNMGIKADGAVDGRPETQEADDVFYSAGKPITVLCTKHTQFVAKLAANAIEKAGIPAHILTEEPEEYSDELHISAVRWTPDANELKLSGYALDSLTDFPPHLVGLLDVDHDDEKRFGTYRDWIKDYRKVCKHHMEMPKQDYTYFRSVMLEWDNTARAKIDARVFEEFSFTSFKKWLYYAKRYALRQNRPGEDLVFINAWNEWAEGTYLEPSEPLGRTALESAREALEWR